MKNKKEKKKQRDHKDFKQSYTKQKIKKRNKKRKTKIKERRMFTVFCLQFYVRLGPESPLNESQIIQDRLSSSTTSMPARATMFVVCMNSTRMLGG
jgi:hypothetical protein